MAKNIPAKDFKEAVKSLNVKLKEDGEKPIKLVGVKKEAVVESFTNTVLDFIENNKAEELPDNVIELYNTYIVADDEEDEEEKPAKKTSTKKTPAKKSTTKTGAKKSTTKKKPTEKVPGVVETAVRLWCEGNESVDSILEELTKVLPNKNPRTTIIHVVGVMKHVSKYWKN